MFLLFCMVNLHMPDQPKGLDVSPKMLTTMQYHPIIKAHGGFRFTVRTKVNCNNFSSEIDRIEANPVEMLPAVVRYNIRGSYYLYKGKYRIYFGRETMLLAGKPTIYSGIRIKI